MSEHQIYNHQVGMSLDEFVDKNKRLAYKIANKYRSIAERNMDDLEDYEQICLLGLIKAYHRYDPESTGSKAKATTFAVAVIKSEITTFLRDKSCIIRYPREFSLVWSRIRSNGLEDERDHNVIAEIIDIDPKIVKESLSFFNEEQPLSFQGKTKISNEHDENTLEAHLGTYSDFSIIYVHDFMNTLSDIERNILSLFLEDKSQTEIAQIVGYGAVSSVSRSLRRIKYKLREYYQYAKSEV